MAQFNNVYVHFSPGPMCRIGRSDLERNEHKQSGPYLRSMLANKRMNDFISSIRLATKYIGAENLKVLRAIF